jgi:hypothetical protein
MFVRGGPSAPTAHSTMQLMEFIYLLNFITILADLLLLSTNVRDYALLLLLDLLYYRLQTNSRFMIDVMRYSTSSSRAADVLLPVLLCRDYSVFCVMRDYSTGVLFLEFIISVFLFDDKIQIIMSKYKL